MSEAVTLKSISEEIAAKVLLTKKDARIIVDALVGRIGKSLSEGHEVSIFRIGKFQVMEKPARKGRNPKTGESVEIPAKKVVRFKAARALKDAI
ncbi:MAG: HU family DNA-binding protein [Acidithiobacillus sp.]